MNAAELPSSRIMLHVLAALMPGVLVLFYWFGVGVLINLVLCLGTAMIVEQAVLKLRRQKTKAGLHDMSALVASALLALSLPAVAPWWLPVFGAAIAMLAGKHLYGGLGFNPFNPAMVAYAVLLISFPQQMTAWPDPDADLNLHQSLSVVFSDSAEYESAVSDARTTHWDAMTRQTPLDRSRELRTKATATTPPNPQPLSFAEPWAWINLAFLAGGVWLLIKRIIDWRIPVSFIAALSIMTLLDNAFSAVAVSLPVALFSGATMLGAFFIATDPVTAATTRSGRLIYGFGIGFWLFVIRRYGAFPDGLAFSVLLMNLSVPLIDYTTRTLNPRVR